MNWKKIDPDNPPRGYFLCRNVEDEILYGELSYSIVGRTIKVFDCNHHGHYEEDSLFNVTHYFDPADLGDDPDE